MSFNAFNVVLKSQYASHLCIVNGNKGDASGQRLAQLMFLEYVHGIIFDVAQAASRSFLTRVHTLFLLSVFLNCGTKTNTFYKYYARTTRQQKAS